MYQITTTATKMLIFHVFSQCMTFDAKSLCASVLFPGITSFDLMATVTSPGGVTEDATINEVEDGLYAVHFVPKELGVHTVSVKYKEIHIPGKCKILNNILL